MPSDLHSLSNHSDSPSERKVTAALVSAGAMLLPAFLASGAEPSASGCWEWVASESCWRWLADSSKVSVARLFLDLTGFENNCSPSSSTICLFSSYGTQSEGKDRERKPSLIIPVAASSAFRFRKHEQTWVLRDQPIRVASITLLRKWQRCAICVWHVEFECQILQK